MNYLQKNKFGIFNKMLNKAKYQSFLKIIFSIFFVLFFVVAIIFPKPTRDFFTATAAPIWKSGDTMINGLKNATGFLSSKSSLVAEVTALKNQIVSLELKQVDYNAVSQENQDLKNLFGRKVTESNGWILARVLSKPPQSPYDTFVIDAGSNEGFTIGDKIYISDTILVGQIASVENETSIINLFSKSGLTNFLTDERTGGSYKVTGQGGANMSVEAPKDADILWGDTFNYPGINTSVVGSVFYIDQSAQSSFKTIYLRIPGNVFQTKWVMVEK